MPRLLRAEQVIEPTEISVGRLRRSEMEDRDLAGGGKECGFVAQRAPEPHHSGVDAAATGVGHRWNDVRIV